MRSHPPTLSTPLRPGAFSCDVTHDGRLPCARPRHQCGEEMNYIKAAVAPIVFQDVSACGTQLLYAGSLSVPFLPGQMQLCPDTGRLFHPYNQHGSVDGLPAQQGLGLGLIKSHLCLALAESIEVDEASGALALVWQGERHAINEYEP